MKARYIRISTPDQKLERQHIKQHPGEKLYIDICSGSIPFNERPEGQSHLFLVSNSLFIVVKLNFQGL